MSDNMDEDYVYDEASGEWISTAEAQAAAAQNDAVEVRGLRQHHFAQLPLVLQRC